MLFFFNGNLNTGLQNEVLAQKCNDKLKVRLFQISDEEIVKFYESANLLYEKYRDPSVFGDLNATIAGSIEFRENVGLKNSGALDEIRQKLTTQVATPIDLISNYLLEIYQLKKELAKSPDDTFGKVTFLAGLSGASGSSSLKLFVHLKGVANLRPRQNKEECNFRLVVSVLPLKVDDKNYKISQKSLIYPAKINHLVMNPWILILSLFVVHFDQRLGATHSKRWSKYEMLKKHISTSIWSMLHPSAGQNIQQFLTLIFFNKTYKFYDYFGCCKNEKCLSNFWKLQF